MIEPDITLETAGCCTTSNKQKLKCHRGMMASPIGNLLPAKGIESGDDSNEQEKVKRSDSQKRRNSQQFLLAKMSQRSLEALGDGILENLKKENASIEEVKYPKLINIKHEQQMVLPKEHQIKNCRSMDLSTYSSTTAFPEVMKERKSSIYSGHDETTVTSLSTNSTRSSFRERERSFYVRKKDHIQQCKEKNDSFNFTSLVNSGKRDKLFKLKERLDRITRIDLNSNAEKQKKLDQQETTQHAYGNGLLVRKGPAVKRSRRHSATMPNDTSKTSQSSLLQIISTSLESNDNPKNSHSSLLKKLSSSLDIKDKRNSQPSLLKKLSASMENETGSKKFLDKRTPSSLFPSSEKLGKKNKSFDRKKSLDRNKSFDNGAFSLW